MLVLSGSSFTIGYSVFERSGLKGQREKLVNKIKYDKIPDPTADDIDFGLDEPARIYYR